METQRRTHDGEDIVKQPETSSIQKKVMTEKKKKKKKKIPDEEEEGEDRISQLPDEILHHILSLIPLKRAARTSILSNRWKELWESKWAYTNTLNFDWKFTFGIKTLSLASSTINRILQLHIINTIQVFRLYFPPWNEFLPHIQQWIEFAVEKRARELDLDFKEYHNPLSIAKLSHDFDGGVGYAKLSYDGGGGGGGGDDDGDDALLFLTTMTKKRKIRELSPYNLPHCLFFCDSLTSLKLANCKLELPSDFRGFSSLKTLHLRGVAFSHYTLDEMLLKCPMLEDLALMFWDKFNKLQLSPTYLKIKSFIMIGFHRSCMAGSFLSKLAHLRILTICQHRGWESKPAPRNSPITLPNVIELQLMVNGEYRLPDISSWFIFWNFPCLKTIVINRFFGIDDQMQMVKFLLQKAVVLETMVLVIPKGGIKGSLRNDSIPQAKSNVAQLRLLHELLLHLPKVSKNARFVLKECTDVDDSIVATLYGDLNSPFTLF